MSENLNGAEQNTQSQQKPMQTQIQVHSQYIKDLSFENPNSPESLISGWGAPETNVQVNIQYRPLNEEKQMFEVVLLYRIEAKNKEHDKAVFIVELAYGCTVTLGNVAKEHLEPVLMIELPKLLFPFSREIISSAVVQGGYPPLFIQPINFEAIYMQKLKQSQEQQKANKETTDTDEKDEVSSDSTTDKKQA